MKAAANLKNRKVKVEVGPRVYLMNEPELREFLNVCKSLVPFGIYAVRKDDFVSARNEKARSVTHLKQMKAEYKKHGFEVYANEQADE